MDNINLTLDIVSLIITASAAVGYLLRMIIDSNNESYLRLGQIIVNYIKEIERLEAESAERNSIASLAIENNNNYILEQNKIISELTEALDSVER